MPNTNNKKELDCLYRLSDLANQQYNAVEEILPGILKIIPPAWQYPEITEVIITYNNKEYKTSHFIKTKWVLRSDIIVNGKKAGKIEVFYMKNMPRGPRGPFLAGEKKLLNAIAERLGKMANHKIIAQELKSAYEKMEKRVQLRTRELIREIEENKRLQTKATQVKYDYENAINSIMDSICVVNRHCIIKNCNLAFAEKVGLPIIMIKGKTCHDIFLRYENNLFSARCSNHTAVLDKNCFLYKTFNAGRAETFVEKCRNKNGKYHYYRINVFPARNEKKEVRRVVITIRDITINKTAEEEIRRLSEINQRILDNVPVSIVMLDKDCRIIAANELAKNLIADNPREKITGKKLTAKREIAGNPALLKLYDDLLIRGKSFYYDNLEYRSGKNGGKKSLNVIAIPLHDNKRKVEGAISMALDNTEAVQAKEKLKKLNQELENKVRIRTRELDTINKKLSRILDLKSKFVADASHELRTPLTVIQGNMDLAIREAENSDCKEVPEIYPLIIDEVERMRLVLTDLTMLTNVDIGSEQIAYEKISLGQIINAAIMSLKVLSKQKNITLGRVGNSKNAYIMGDEAKLEKLLLNIIRNGIKYTEPGGWVKVWVEKSDEEARINVEDNGIGIPEDDLPYIFERFYRVDKARSRKEGGSGLGLSIAKWIAEAHSGSIKVKSVLGKGSKFTIHLPYDYKKQNEAATLFG